MTRKPVGKLLSPVKRGQVCALVAVGCSRLVAAQYVGCEVEDIPYTAERSRRFRRQLEQADSQHEIAHLENIRTAGKKSWRASAWSLERRYPGRYGARKADSYSAEQVRRLLNGVMQVVLEEVHDAQVIARIQLCLAEASFGLHSKAEAET